jgi:biopolymer transport protein ExbD
MGGRRDDDEIFADINITPFVDIILVVLILFMVTATTIVQSTIPVDLPDAATGEASTEISLGLTLTQTGELLLDGTLVNEATLRLRLKEAKATGESVVCLIAADTSTPHGRVVWLLTYYEPRASRASRFKSTRPQRPPSPALTPHDHQNFNEKASARARHPPRLCRVLAATSCHGRRRHWRH